MSQREPVCVYRPTDQWQGELIVQHLSANKIDAHLANAASVALWGDGSTSFVALEVLVPKELAGKAARMIDEFLETKNSPETP